MSLPTLAIKTEKVKLPVSGKTIEVRPFTIREQKAILLISEGSKDKSKNKKINYLLSELSRLLQTCVVNDISLEELSLPDFLTVVLNIRSLSVGETAQLTYTCPCQTKVKFTFDINKVFCHNKKKKYEKVIQITPDVSIVIDNITIKKIMEMNLKNTQDLIFETIKKCITKIVDSETVYLTSEVDDEELTQFVDGLPIKVVEEIKSFYDTLPVLKYKDTIECPTGKIEMEVSNLDDFFW